MKTHPNSILLVTSLLFFILVTCVFDKYFYQNNKKIIEKFDNINNINNSNNQIIENFDNNSYTQFNETIVPNSFSQPQEKGNLDQCKKNCDDDGKCVGFSRNKVDDETNGECNLIYDMDSCLNENKKPSENINLSPGISVDFQQYNTFLKNRNNDKYNIERMKCIALNEIVSLKHTKYPFDFVYQKDDNSLEMIKVENSSEDTEKVKSIFKLVKGLSGSGVSFKGPGDTYLVNIKGREEIKLEQMIDSGQFKKDASFEIDNQYSDKSNLFSIRKMVGNTDLYWKVNQTNKKIIMTNINDIGLDKSPILFETVHPMIDTFNIAPVVVQAPTIEPEPETIEDINEEKQTELEKLELEIREVQHNQNMKLMDIMLDVNKFKLMDLSMSDYLTKCNRTSSEELIRVVPVES